MRTLLFTLMLLGCSLALAATVYRWVDENGVVHYSDQPHPNAAKVPLREPQTFKELPLPVAPTVAEGATPAASAPAYRGCALAAPTNGEDFANVPSINLVVQTDPPLRPGDQVFMSLDGQPLNGGRATGPQFVLSPVDRGTHTLQAVVKDSTGALLCQAPGVTFNVHQPSIQNPANPVRPH